MAAPGGLASAGSGALQCRLTSEFLVADSGNHAIRRLHGDGRVETVFGTGAPGHHDDLDPLRVTFNDPQGMAYLKNYGDGPGGGDLRDAGRLQLRHGPGAFREVTGRRFRLATDVRCESNGSCMDIRNLLQLGDGKRKARDFPGAELAYLAILDQNPVHARALLGLGDALRGQGATVRALAAWDAYLEVWPPTAPLLARMGDACRKLGRIDQAAQLYRDALDQDVAYRHALAALGDLCLKAGRAAEALGYWDRLLELDPGLVHILTLAGNLHRKQQAFAPAEARFRQALVLEPDNPHVLFGLADALRGQRRYQDAAPFWEAVLALGAGSPPNPQVLARAGDCFMHLGQLERAEALFTAGCQQGFHKPALMGLARIDLAHGRFQAAMDRCLGILAEGPEDARVRALLREAEAGLPPEPAGPPS
jgi:tetratricopeptide (TPR) repeat protein